MDPAGQASARPSTGEPDDSGATDHRDARVSVVIPCYADRRWPLLVAAVDSVRAQSPAPAAIIVAVDNNTNLYDRAKRELVDVTVVANSFAQGVAGTRNTGVLHTSTPLVALLDDDARAHPGWLSALIRPFDDPNVVGTGGLSLARWEDRQPRWFPPEFLWAVGASTAEITSPDRDNAVRNVWSLTMAIRRDAFEEVSGFQEHFTKVGDRSRPEDTDLCLRMSKVSGGRWIHVPEAVVDHSVPKERARLRYLSSRCFEEARGKVGIARRLKTYVDLDLERRYVTRTVPKALARGISDALRRRDAAGLARAGVVVLCAVAAGLGAATETIRPSYHHEVLSARRAKARA